MVDSIPFHYEMLILDSPRTFSSLSVSLSLHQIPLSWNEITKHVVLHWKQGKWENGKSWREPVPKKKEKKEIVSNPINFLKTDFKLEKGDGEKMRVLFFTFILKFRRLSLYILSKIPWNYFNLATNSLPNKRWLTGISRDFPTIQIFHLFTKNGWMDELDSSAQPDQRIHTKTLSLVKSFWPVVHFVDISVRPICV